MRRSSILGLVFAIGIVGCVELDYERPPEIVFGIDQRGGQAGTARTTAGWELLAVGAHGWAPFAHVDRGRSCWLEDRSKRVGQPRVEGGAAVFRGGRLPAEGLLVPYDAVEGVVRRDAVAWEDGDRLTFEARGFAMPEIPPIEIYPPSTKLVVHGPPVGAEPLALRRHEELVVAWDPADERSGDRVLVVLAGIADEASEIRCFFPRSAGRGSVPRVLLEALPLASGTMTIGTHRQHDVFASGGWIVYVVATNVVREQPFVTTNE